MRRFGKLAILALTPLLVVAGDAVGAVAQQNDSSALIGSGRPGSYLIVESLNTTAPAGLQTFGSINCPANAAGAPRYPYSGGVTINSTSLSVNINSSYPSGTAWHAYVNNASQADVTFDIWAVCALPKTGYTVVSTHVINHAGSQDIGIANCPTGLKVLGGGVLSWSQDLAVNLFTSVPTHIGGFWNWYGVENNASGNDTSFDVEVVCSKYPTWAYTIHSGGGSSPAGTQSFGSAPCLAPQVPIGGGVQGYAGFLGYLSVNISSTWPMPGSGWGARQNNGSGTNTHFGMIAICAGT